MASIFSRLSTLGRKKQQPIALSDQEKGQEYERDATRPPTRLSKSAPSFMGAGGRPRARDQDWTQDQHYVGSFAPNPLFVKTLRFLLYGLTSLASLATAGVGIAVVQYYNSHEPVIKPSWGSLIAVIVFGIGTPGVLFGLFLVTPRLFRPGGVGSILNQTRIELVALFNVSVVWISGALALACDLRGREFCLWDGYWHYPKPADFDNVCELINVTVALAYTTFGLCALQMSVVFLIVGYILLFLDQEVLTEPTNDMGGRAHRARLAAMEAHRQRRAADNGVSTAGPLSNSPMSEVGPMAGGVPSSRRVPVAYRDGEASGMMAGGASYRDVDRDVEDGDRRSHSSGSRAHPDLDEEEEEEEHGNMHQQDSSGYYGFGSPRGHAV